MINEKYEFDITCRYKNKTHRKTVSATYPKNWYIKHAPRSTLVLESNWIEVHPEILDQITRDIAFMDRTCFVESRCRSPILGLAHKYKPKYSEWGFNPYCFGGGENVTGFDHTTAWRRPIDKWPLLILTEPYSFSDEEREQCNRICEETKYRYKVFKPSSRSLWNNNCYMVFWWHSDYYEPDFNVLMPIE